MAHPDLPAEQAYIDRAYERLEAVRAETEAQLREAFRERGGTFQSFTERDIRVRNGLNRLEKLQLGREALIFGRIDRAHSDADAAPAGAAAPTGALADADAGPVGEDGRHETFHIGRLAISDAEHEPLVVDWRAPVAEPFYRATGARPMGLRRRRHFLTDGRRVIDLEDELFAQGDGTGGAEALGLAGPSVLLAALARAHTGRMRDIVATVQAEQDEIIRAPLTGALVVQGGPGTGKTAVALHRAAYLLYTYRFPLEVQGVLVVGPNPTFLRYIDQVLPSLGETGVELSTASGLYKRARPVAAEPSDVARLKGDPRMAQFIRRAVHQRERPLRKTAEIPYGRAVLTLTPEASAEIVAAARRRSGTHNVRRRAVETLLWEHLAGELERRAEANAARSGADIEIVLEATGAGEDLEELLEARPAGARPAEVGAELRRRPMVAELLERMWPRLTPEALLHDLFGAKPLIELAGKGALSAREFDLLYRPRSASLEEVHWTQADIALLDEASWLLGPQRAGPPNEQPNRTYGHIVVDEVQDLSPMELRMVGRRSLSGSMTLVGDIAQATGPWAPASWDELMAHVPRRREWRLVGLSVSYRAPAEVMALARRVLAVALPGVSPPEPVRHTGQAPRFLSLGPHPEPGDAGVGLGGNVGSNDAAWLSLIGRTVAEEVSAVAAARGRDDDGSVGVLVPAALLADVRSALAGEGIVGGEVGAGALDTQVSLLALGDAKGLEFDSVVVVEPAGIVAQSPSGMRALYVALTRCTRRLAIVYREPLPAPLLPVDGSD
ncbi:MAG TPA: AAA family ATPase [Acidimicrobiales bacterium]|nr:AAA family ATPase [Acidimicrobiales bacterium]